MRYQPFESAHDWPVKLSPAAEIEQLKQQVRDLEDQLFAVLEHLVKQDV